LPKLYECFGLIVMFYANEHDPVHVHGKCQLKDLKKENRRDHMINSELVLNMLAEATTTEISRAKQPAGFEESKVIAQQGGTIAGNTRKEIEEKTGKKIVTEHSPRKLK
jgi:hypothetical protein